MELNPAIFREYDIRGIVGIDVDEDVYELLGKSFAAYLRGKKKHNAVCVARDGRLHSKRMAQAFIDGLTSAGLNVIDIGLAPTPLLYYGIHTLPVDAGAMVTASHNPSEYNGLKCTVGTAALHGDQIRKLYDIAIKGDFPVARKPVTITRMDIADKYINRIVRDVKPKRKMKIVVDAGNGASGPLAVKLYEAMGCEVIPLYCDVDGNFPNHHPDPTKLENLKDLIRLVKKHKADLGLGIDGDGDRIGGCDELGNMLAGDRLLALFARSVLKDKPGSVIIGEVKCSRGLYEDIEAHGGKAIMSRTGHSPIKAKMTETKAQLAGEMSGHMFFKHRWYGFDDATYSGARLIELVSESKQPLSKLLASIPQRETTPEIEIMSDDRKKFDVVRQAQRYFKDELGLNVITVDGARIEFEDGWGLLRASNTSPKLVMRVEADTKKRLNEIKKMIEQKVAEWNA
jgi:phosphomannomutase/phosphoglucomutase